MIANINIYTPTPLYLTALHLIHTREQYQNIVWKLRDDEDQCCFILLVRMFAKKDVHKLKKLKNVTASSIGVIDFVECVYDWAVRVHVLPYDGPAPHRTVACAWCPGCTDSC